MKMTIGDRVVVAKINKREDARREYEQAKQQGKSARQSDSVGQTQRRKTGEIPIITPGRRLLQALRLLPVTCFFDSS